MVLSDCVDKEVMGCGYNAFKEHSEIISLIAKLRKCDTEGREVEKNFERYKFVLSQYQDQPHLLDPYLEVILGALISIVKDDDATEDMKNNAFKYLFVLMSVKRYKNIVTYLPHEVRTFLRSLFSINSFFSMSDKSTTNWLFLKTHYFLAINNE